MSNNFCHPLPKAGLRESREDFMREVVDSGWALGKRGAHSLTSAAVMLNEALGFDGGVGYSMPITAWIAVCGEQSRKW